MTMSTTMSFEQSVSNAIEAEIKKETIAIMEKYKKLMEADLQEAQGRVVANMALRMSSHMSIAEDGRTIRIEISKREER